MNLLTVKQHLRKKSDLSEHEKQAISEITGQDVRNGEVASNALVHLFGQYDSFDRSPETLRQLRELNAKFETVRRALGLPSCLAPAEDVSASQTPSHEPSVGHCSSPKSPKRRRPQRLPRC